MLYNDFIITPMFSPNRHGSYKFMNYYEKYFEIINYRKMNKLPDEQYGEKHHIKPKSIYPDLKNDPNNIVRLSAYEHCMVHYYLLKYYETVDKQKAYKMAVAFTNMINLRMEKLHDITSEQLFFLINQYKKHRLMVKNYLSKKFKVMYKDTSFHTQTVEILQYDLNGNFIKEWKGIKHTARILGMYPQEITGCIRGRHQYAKGFIWRQKTQNYPLKIEPLKIINGMTKIPILQYSLSGEFIKQWDSIYQVSQKFGLKHIRISDTNIQHMSCGFMWVRKNGEITKRIPPYKPNSGPRKIDQYDKNLNFIREWNSIKDASIELNISRSMISNSLRGVSKYAGGFIWKYNVNMTDE